MGLFPLDLKKIIILIVIFSIPIFLINVQRKEEKLSWLFKPAFVTAGFLQDAYSNYSRSVKKTAALYLNLIDIKKENRILQENMALLETQLTQFEEIKKENERLQGLLDFKQTQNHQLLAARVIGHDLLGQHSTLFIDKGSDAGIAPGMSVVTPEGVVGSVLNVEKNLSQILTLTDRYSAIDVVIERSRARGILEGVSPTKTKLKYLQRTDDVQVGDKIITTGLDKIFPKGFPVGMVHKVEKKDYGITQDVQVKPLVSTFDVENIFVVVKTNDMEEVKEKMKEMSKKD